MIVSFNITLLSAKSLKKLKLKKKAIGFIVNIVIIYGN